LGLKVGTASHWQEILRRDQVRIASCDEIKTSELAPKKGSWEKRHTEQTSSPDKITAFKQVIVCSSLAGTLRG